ncbi:putative ribosome biogenesis GTPase RsgA [Spirochaetia bacterium]|nr:putative ribosome biogenesis GTPase RsgA [Spirochaetia bacterium]GHU30062.1 putative ribosome biogenesis GTPase RsgA [Spirochaetia bacterium]
MFNLTQYGFARGTTEDMAKFQNSADAEKLIPGRVIEMQRELYKLVSEYGEVPAKLPGAFYHGAQAREDFPAVGDFVLFSYNSTGNSLISQVLPRRSKFSRADFSGHKVGYAKNIVEQIVASNFDYVFILCSLNYDFSPARIGRYLSASWQSGGFPVVVLTKADLVPDYTEQVETVQAMAHEIPVIAVSSKTTLGLMELAPFLEPGKTIVFLGSSGVGKSSLLNALAGETVMEVKGIREDDSKGRHTTTHRQLVMLNTGAMVIDTPGMRELGLWNAEEGIHLSFAGVEELIERCRFSNCTHQSELGCAVQAALEDGSLLPEQWKRYNQQKNEAAYVESKSAFLREKALRQKSIARYNRSKMQN